MSGKPALNRPAEAGGVSNIIEWVLTEIECNHPHDWSRGVIDELLARLRLAAEYLPKIEGSLRRVAQLIEGTYAHDEAGNRLDDAEANMSGADCFAELCGLETVVFEALNLVAYRKEQQQTAAMSGTATASPVAEQGRAEFFVLLIGHDQGVHAFVCDTRETARARLAEYVAGEWPLGVARPASSEPAISRYFQELYIGCQWYEIRQTRLLTGVQTPEEKFR